ncbi:MAG: histone family protein DNA-binding protein [Rickettsiaceae bacterium]|jgi:DNA-binding protein HU-beta|nr:histone family protein DNA-binding protein [Rickettsiaceae bacterium]
MNKSEFVSLMANQSKCSKAEAERALNMTLEAIKNVIEKKETLTLVGFGVFSVKKRAARDGINPKTGQKMKIKAFNQPIFKPGKGLKDACN